MNHRENPYQTAARPRPRFPNATLWPTGGFFTLGSCCSIFSPTIGLVLAVGGAEPDGVRIGLGARGVLCWVARIWLGHRVAVRGFTRWGTLFGLIAVFQDAPGNAAWPLGLGLGVTAVYAAITWAFIRSKSLDAFFKHQARRRRELPGEALPKPEPLGGRRDSQRARRVDGPRLQLPRSIIA